jgi:hypothetical protein
MSGFRALTARIALATAVCALFATNARAQTTEWLCDASYENCRDPLVNLIRNENVGIDVAFWFMEDARLSSEIIKRWQAGVPGARHHRPARPARLRRRGTSGEPSTRSTSPTAC